MGAVLAMRCIFILAFVGLTACGPLAGNSSIDTIRSVTGANAQGESVATGPLAGWALAGISEQSSGQILLNIFEQRVAVAMVQVGNNGSRVTWVSANGVSLTLDDGVVIATRGLGGDLMGVDTPIKGNGLQTPSNHPRTHDFLNGLGQIVRREFRCVTSFWKDETLEISEQTFEAKAYREVCEGEEYDFTNTYWMTTDGSIRQSSQWISPEVGQIGYQRL